MSWEQVPIATVTFGLELTEIAGKDRPRFSGVGKPHTTPRTKSLEQQIAWAFKAKAGGRYSDFGGEVHMRVASYRCLYKSNPKYWQGRADLGKPDCDNVLKLVMDALNGLAYRDDSQVTTAVVRKMPRLPHAGGNHITVELRYFEEQEQ